MNEDNATPTPKQESAGANDDPQASAEPAAESPAAESHAHEIDLNTLFPDAEEDLNALFPDEEMKQFLKSVSRNKKDLSALNERFIQENQRDVPPEDLV